jgi:hypothetical protein
MVPNEVVARLKPSSTATVFEQLLRGSTGTTADAVGPVAVLGPAAE